MKKDVLQYEMGAAGIGVYCGTYRKYNNGSLYGMWIDFTACADADEFFEVCRKLHDAASDPELMFQDYQGFPDSLYSECMGKDLVEKIITFANMDDDERELFEDYTECYGGDVWELDDLDAAKERCVGSGYDSLEDYFNQQADEMLDQYEAACKHDYSCKGAAPMIAELRKYFDYGAYAREQESYYSIGSNGHVFCYC